MKREKLRFQETSEAHGRANGSREQAWALESLIVEYQVEYQKTDSRPTPGIIFFLTTKNRLRQLQEDLKIIFPTQEEERFC